MVRATIAAALLLLPLPVSAGEQPCAVHDGVTARVRCHADRAVAGASRAACDRASDAHVRDQCYGVYAVRTGDAASCRAIPGDSRRAASLRQICLSDVAIATGDAAVCREIDDTGLRDTCHLKVARDTNRTALCERIEQSALRGLCLR